MSDHQTTGDICGCDGYFDDGCPACTPAPDLRMLSPVELADGLRGLAEHRDAGNLSAMEAALLQAAATYLSGATDSLREHMALLRTAREETAAVRMATPPASTCIEHAYGTPTRLSFQIKVF